MDSASRACLDEFTTINDSSEATDDVAFPPAGLDERNHAKRGLTDQAWLYRDSFGCTNVCDLVVQSRSYHRLGNWLDGEVEDDIKDDGRSPQQLGNALWHNDSLRHHVGTERSGQRDAVDICPDAIIHGQNVALSVSSSHSQVNCQFVIILRGHFGQC